MKGLFWAIIAFGLATAAGCTGQTLKWEDPYMQKQTGPQPGDQQRNSGP